MRALFLLITGLGLCLTVPACSGGPRLIKVTGKLTLNNKPLPAESKDTIQVAFISLNDEGKSENRYPAVINKEDMTFVVGGKDGHGIPAGKYRIAVQQFTSELNPEVLERNKRFSRESSP